MNSDEPPGEHASRDGTDEQGSRTDGSDAGLVSGTGTDRARRSPGLSRRAALTGVASAGLTGALAGALAWASNSDTEPFETNTLAGGNVDLTVGWTVIEGEFVDDPQNVCQSAELDDREEPVVRIDDLEAGDEGSLTVCLHRSGGPAYLWTRLRVTADLENDLTSGEEDAGDDTRTEGELAEALEASVWIDPDCDGTTSLDRSGTLAEVGAALEGGVQVGSPETTGACLGLAWRLPEDADATVRTDRVEVALEFVGEQARHNDDTNPWGGS